MSDNPLRDTPLRDAPLRDANGHFAKGNPGGPGRRRSAVSRGAVALDEIGADAGKQVVQALVEKALAGDTRAMDLLLSRVWPARRGRPLEIDATPIKSVPDYMPAASDVTNAVLRGEITPQEGRDVSSMLGLQIKTIDYTEIARQIKELKEQVDQQRGGNAAAGERATFEPYSTDRATVFDGFSGGSDGKKA